jgi:subtilase family serine protease
MSPSNELEVSAEAILKSKTGRSLARPGEPITQQNIEEFLPSQETVQKAAQFLRDLGFRVEPAGVTLTVTGKASRFEDVFKVKLGAQTHPAGGIRVQPEGELQLPDVLRDVVEQVVFPEPPEYFTQP